jgi:hypothetical protein
MLGRLADNDPAALRTGNACTCFGAPAARFCSIDRKHSCPQMAWSQIRETVAEVLSPPDRLTRPLSVPSLKIKGSSSTRPFAAEMGKSLHRHLPIKRGRRHAMARIYRDVAIEQMLLTIEEAMSRVIDWWGDLPSPMKDEIEEFRIQLGQAIDSVELVKKALAREMPESDDLNGPV